MLIGKMRKNTFAKEMVSSEKHNGEKYFFS